MKDHDRVTIGELWLNLAQMYGKEISRGALTLMLNAVNDLDPRKVEQALNEWASTSKVGRHPFPAEIREKIEPPVDDRLIAIEIARKIDKACIKHGHYWSQGIMGHDGFYFEDEKGCRFPTFKEAVLSELGPLGWHAICSRGGWEQISQSANEMDEGQFIAQLRDQISASMSLQRSGVDVSKMSLPSPKQEGLVPIGGSEFFKQLEEKRKEIAQ